MEVVPVGRFCFWHKAEGHWLTPNVRDPLKAAGPVWRLMGLDTSNIEPLTCRVRPSRVRHATRGLDST